MYVIIIGAGPIGCYAAYLLAESGHKVEVYENHEQVGAPIQCTGILTKTFDKLDIPLEPSLVNTIRKIKVIAPNQETLVQEKNHIICRTKFDQSLAKLATDAGANIYTSHTFLRKEQKVLIIKDTKQNKLLKKTPDIVIAADGPLSPTAKAYGFYHKDRENFYGVQAVVKGNFEKDTITTYFGNNICPDLFAWITPESSTRARVGLAMKKESKPYFDKFIKEHNFKIEFMQAGTIPLFEPKQSLHKENCYLVGDASGYVKATTLGGLIPGFKQVNLLAKAINEKKDYQSLTAPLRRQLKLHKKIHSALTKMSDKDMNCFVRYANQPRIRKILEKYTRDDPIPLVFFSLLKEPRFLRFLKYA